MPLLPTMLNDGGRLMLRPSPTANGWLELMLDALKTYVAPLSKLLSDGEKVKYGDENEPPDTLYVLTCAHRRSNRGCSYGALHA